MYRLHYAPDNASLIVRLALDEMDLRFETVLVDRRIEAQKSAAYRRLNPRGLIPVLETPGGAMFETAAILIWLTEQTGQLAPGPGDPGRAVFLSWLVALSNGVQTDLSHLTHPDRYVGDAPEAQAVLGAQAHRRIREMLGFLDARADSGAPWFAAEAPTVLDLYVAVILRWLALYPQGATDWFRLADWPRLAALARRIEARPSVQRAIEAEGLGATPFSAPLYPDPRAGSAT
jgi:glutathione S-transferase